MNLHKDCSKCLATLPLDSFRKSPRGKFGTHSICRPCSNAQAKVYQAENRATVPSVRAQYRAREAEAINGYMTAYRVENKVAITAQRATYYLANTDLLLQKASAYAKANPLKMRAATSRRRARVIAAQGSHTDHDIRRLLTLQRFKCACCAIGVKRKFHVDHIVPLAGGGSNSAENLQILCQPCNNKKYTKDLIEFMQPRGFLL